MRNRNRPFVPKHQQSIEASGATRVPTNRSDTATDRRQQFTRIGAVLNRTALYIKREMIVETLDTSGALIDTGFARSAAYNINLQGNLRLIAS